MCVDGASNCDQYNDQGLSPLAVGFKKVHSLRFCDTIVGSPERDQRSAAGT